MRLVFATAMALLIQASQQVVATGTRKYSKPAASAASITRSNSAADGWMNLSRSP